MNEGKDMKKEEKRENKSDDSPLSKFYMKV
jgi:hypothetical protein